MLVFCPLAGHAQTLITGAISGDVIDQTGAVIPNASISARNTATGEMRQATSGTAGHYALSQLAPGQYMVTVKASGFRILEQGPITVATSQTVTLDFKLEVGKTTEIVEVSGEAPLMSTQNPNNTATVSQLSLANLPNPGMDLTYAAQIAPGATMNTSGGYGNVEFNGLPAESTNFTIDGIDANDPFLNLNNSGATNLQLGLNAIQETTVNTLSFSVDQGRQGAAQVNYISKSGTNNFHGNAYEVWNGSKMNASNYFLNAVGPTCQGGYGDPGCKPFSNLNQFGGSVGGPILKNKLFFFFDWEETRIVLPVSATDVITPTPAFEQYTLNALTTGGTDPLNGLTFAPPPNTSPAITYYKHMFDLYGTKTGSPYVITGCPFNADGTSATNGDGCGIKSAFGVGNFTKDRLWQIRVDQHVGDNNTLWYHFSHEAGVQATGTDPINPAFNPYSSQPQVAGAAGWTHTFGPTVVNEFNPGFFWYSALFGPVFQQALAVSPFQYDGPFTSIWSTGTAGYPQGRKVTNWQLIDNLTWTRGTHVFKFGENMRRTLISDHDPSASIAPDITPGDIYEWAFGVADTASQNFVTNGNQPLAVTNLDLYAGDSWKAKPNLTVSYGLRATWNSNLVSKHDAYSRMIASFYSISHDVNQPLNQVVKTGLSQLLPSTQLIVWQPRGAIAWEVKHNTVIRAGIGKFSDLFPYVLADTGLTNFPNVNAFVGGVSGNVTSTYAIPGSGDGVYESSNNDVVTAMAQANQAVVQGFANGATSCYAATPTTPCLSRPTFTAFPSTFMPYPYFLEWSAGVEHQFRNNWSIKTQYVGTKATQLAYNFRPNQRQLYCDGCFAPYPMKRLDNRFGTVNQWDRGTNSTYAGWQTTVQKRISHGLQFSVNYAWSHCLDTVSNGGRFAFAQAGSTNWIHPYSGDVHRNYGSCDFDVRNSLNGSYVYQLPTFTHKGLLGQVVNGWQVSGDVFFHSGFPLTAVSSNAAHLSGLNGRIPQYANANPGVPIYSRNVPISGVTVSPGEVQWLNPNAFTSVINPDTGDCVGAVPGVFDPTHCQFGNAGRNTLNAPGFRWGDFFLTKRFKIRENMAIRIEGQFYNIFNHPNFGYPGSTYGVPGVADTLIDKGVVTGTTNPPTGLLGSGLGGDTSVRMIALSARFEF
jgi:hypothetical protein